MSFQKDFDELFNNILTDYKNQFPEADTSQGSLIFIKSACLASALWSLYKYQDYIAQQCFPDTADAANLDHHGWILDIARTYNETDAAYLARVLARLRRPPAGGNANDYIQWALEIDNVAQAYCYPLAQGLGTVDVIVVANETNTGSEVPSSFAMITGTNDTVTANKLKDTGTDFSSVNKGDVVKNLITGIETTSSADGINGEISLTDDIFAATPQDYTVTSLTTRVRAYITDLNPCEMDDNNLRILPPVLLSQAVTMTVTGTNINKVQIAADIEAFMYTLIPDQTLFRAQLISIAIAAGAENAAITVPAADVVPATYEIIRPGVISVT